jgi:hypothetical protein
MTLTYAPRSTQMVPVHTASIPLVVHYEEPTDELDEPRERVHFEPVSFDRLVTGEGFPPVPLNPRQGPRHRARMARLTLAAKLRTWRASR